MNYLIDTNVFFEILRQAKEEIQAPIMFGLDEARKGNCYISYITQIEIVSVIGKYARGGANDWQKCQRTVKMEDGGVGICPYMCRAEAPRKKWPSRRVGALRKLLRDILSGDSGVLSVEVLPVNERVLQKASTFIEKAEKFRFGSLDSIIAGTAKNYEDLSLCIVTKDKGLRAALLEDGLMVYSSSASGETLMAPTA